MSEPIELEHIDWVNDMEPALCQENLNKNQIALEQCVDVANKFNGLTNVSNENSYNYPKERYLANGSRLRSITSALKQKGVESTGIFNNIPKEILSISSGSSMRNCRVFEESNCRITTNDGAISSAISNLIIKTSYNPDPNLDNWISIDIPGFFYHIQKQPKGTEPYPPIGPDDWLRISPNFEIRGYGRYGLQVLFHPDDNITMLASEDFYYRYGEGDLIGLFFCDQNSEYKYIVGR